MLTKVASQSLVSLAQVEGTLLNIYRGWVRTSDTTFIYFKRWIFKHWIIW